MTSENFNKDKSREKEIYKVTIKGSIVNFVLILTKFAAGIFGHSAAIIADAVHSLSDFITDIIVIVFVRISHKPKDENHDYGHGKFETMATLFVGMILFFAGIGIAWNGILGIISVINGETLKTPGVLALIVAVLSIFSKEMLYRYTSKQGKKLNSGLVIANAWHHRSDAFSSIATAAGIGGAIFLGSEWAFLDPLAALIVSLFIVRTAFQLIKPCMDELLEKSLGKETEGEIIRIVNSFKEASNPHNLRTRKIGNYCAIELHVRMDGEIPLYEAHNLVSEIENKLRICYGEKTHVIIHVEPFERSRSNKPE